MNPFKTNLIGRQIMGNLLNRATAALPASTTGPLFTITGGRIVVLSILGEVTTAIQAQATTLKIKSTATVGPVATDLCATADVNALAVGKLLTITGTLATALQTGSAVLRQASPIICPIGSIDLLTVATSTGSVKWTLRWIPMDDLANVAVA